jgi:hypothetical protein
VDHSSWPLAVRGGQEVPHRRLGLVGGEPMEVNRMGDRRIEEVIVIIESGAMAPCSLSH